MAVPATTLETVEYRALILVPKSSAVLAQETVDGYHLPRIFIPLRARPAQQLRKAIQTRWALNVLILEFVKGDDGPTSCVLAELLAPAVGSDLIAISLGQISDSDLSEAERSSLVSLLDGKWGSPFSRIGWIDEASTWLETVTGQTITSKGDIEQLNAGGAFALVRFHTEDGADYWMKATGEPNAHELSITSLLSRLCGDYLPKVIAARPDWNAWLMSGGASPIPELPTDSVMLFSLLEDAVESIAELQLRTMGREQDLLKAGAFDQCMDVLLAHSDALFSYLEECMQFQTSAKVPRIEKGRLHELKQIFENVCRRLSALGIPNAVVHGDMSLANILTRDGHCQFIDWCETYVGSPFITFEHLLLLTELTNHDLKEFVVRVLKERYKSMMSKVCDPAAIDEGLIYTPFLAAASASYGRGTWLQTSCREQPHRQAWARTLARHMERAARSPALHGVLGT
jgi:hypothetical protein